MKLSIFLFHLLASITINFCLAILIHYLITNESSNNKNQLLSINSLELTLTQFEENCILWTSGAISATVIVLRIVAWIAAGIVTLLIVTASSIQCTAVLVSTITSYKITPWNFRYGEIEDRDADEYTPVSFGGGYAYGLIRGFTWTPIEWRPLTTRPYHAPVAKYSFDFHFGTGARNQEVYSAGRYTNSIGHIALAEEERTTVRFDVAVVFNYHRCLGIWQGRYFHIPDQYTERNTRHTTRLQVFKRSVFTDPPFGDEVEGALSYEPFRLRFETLENAAVRDL